MKDLNQQSDEIHKMFRKLTAKRRSWGQWRPSSRRRRQEEQLLMAGFMESLRQVPGRHEAAPDPGQAPDDRGNQDNSSKVVQFLKENSARQEEFLESWRRRRSSWASCRRQTERGHQGYQSYAGAQPAELPGALRHCEDRTRTIKGRWRGTPWWRLLSLRDSPIGYDPGVHDVAYKHWSLGIN